MSTPTNTRTHPTRLAARIDAHCNPTWWSWAGALALVLVASLVVVRP